MSVRRRAAAGVLVALGLLVPLACGGGEPGVSDAATAELRPRTDEIRLLATAGRLEEALVRLADLQTLVADLQAREEITADGAEEILERAEALAAELQLVTTTTTAPPPTQPPPPPEEDDEEDDERGNGNDRDRDRDRDREERDG